MNAGLLGMAGGPQRIVCLTEETTEWLYLLGEERRIAGISGYTVRPRRARDEKPKVSAFLNAKIDKILELRPDCVFGFSDLQADIEVLEREFSDLDEIWKSEKAALQGSTKIKEQIEQARLELEGAQRRQDYARMSEIQYGRLPELEKQLAAAQEAESKDFKLLQDKVTAEEIAEAACPGVAEPVAPRPVPLAQAPLGRLVTN